MTILLRDAQILRYSRIDSNNCRKENTLFFGYESWILLNCLNYKSCDDKRRINNRKIPAIMDTQTWIIKYNQHDYTASVENY